MLNQTTVISLSTTVFTPYRFGGAGGGEIINVVAGLALLNNPKLYALIRNKEVEYTKEQALGIINNMKI